MSDGSSASTANNGPGTSRRSAYTAIHVWGSKWPTWKGMDGVSYSSTCVLRLQEGETAAVEDLWAVIRTCLRKSKAACRAAVGDARFLSGVSSSHCVSHVLCRGIGRTWLLLNMSTTLFILHGIDFLFHTNELSGFLQDI